MIPGPVSAPNGPTTHPYLPEAAEPGSGTDGRAGRRAWLAQAKRPQAKRHMSLPWPVRSFLAGTTGTAALTLCYAAERRLRPRHRGPLDYDDSLVPGQIVAEIMRLPTATAREYQELGTALRWGYGSAFGLAHGLLRRRFREPAASTIFGGTLISATFSLFPLLGHTPPPWRWPADVIATCLGTHVAYVFTVAGVND